MSVKVILLCIANIRKHKCLLYIFQTYPGKVTPQPASSSDELG